MVEHLPGKQKSWVRIPPEAAHFSREDGLSQVLCCLSFVLFNCLSTLYNFHVQYISTENTYTIDTFLVSVDHNAYTQGVVLVGTVKM